MYSHIATFAAHPNLPLITGNVDESSAHRLPYWYLATQGAWHKTEELSERREHSGKGAFVLLIPVQYIAQPHLLFTGLTIRKNFESFVPVLPQHSRLSCVVDFFSNIYGTGYTFLG